MRVGPKTFGGRATQADGQSKACAPAKQSRQRGDSDQLLRGASVAFLAQVGGAGLAFAMQVMLGRWLGVGGYGTYTYTIAWAGLVAVAVGLGLPTTALRFIPAYLAERDWPRLGGILRSSAGLTLATSGGVAIVATIALRVLGMAGVELSWSVAIGFWLVPLLAAMSLSQEIVRALGWMALAYTPTRLVRPVLILVVGLVYLRVVKELTAEAALLITAAATGVVVCAQAGVAWLRLDPAIRSARPKYETIAWLRVALPLLLIASFTIVLSQTDIVMVGSFLGSATAGLYGAAAKTAGLVGLVLVGVSAVAAPMFAGLFAKGEHVRLQALTSNAARWIFWPSLALAVFLAVFSRPVLGLFGSAFPAAQWQLIVLLTGQLVNAAMGPVGYLLILTGHQREAAWVYGLVAAMHVAMNLIAIPLFGAIGAAVATAVSLCVWNIALYALVVRRLGIHASVLSG